MARTQLGDFVWLNVGKVFHGIYQLTYVFFVLFQLNQMFGEKNPQVLSQCFPSAEPGNEVPRSVHGVAVWAAERGLFLQETVWRE